MVAEFRLEKPNISYVNITASNAITDSTLPYSNMDDHNNSSLRRTVNGNILRGGGHALLTGLLDTCPELRPVIMGGPSVEQDQLEQMNHQQYSPAPFNNNDGHYASPDHDGYNGVNTNNNSPRNINILTPRTVSDVTSSLNNSAAGLSNSNGNLDLQPQFNNNNTFPGSNSNSDNGRNFSLNGSDSLSNGNPRIRVANLPRASSSLYDRVPVQNQNTFQRSLSASEQQHQQELNGGLQQEHQQYPSVTIIRSSTLEITGPSAMSHFTHNFNSNGQNFNNDNQMSSSHLANNGASCLQNNTNTTVQSFASANVGEERGSTSRKMMVRPHRNLRSPDGSGGAGVGAPYCHMARVSQQTDMASGVNGDNNNNGMLQGLLKNQQTLVKENEDLKRKLYILVNTINDKQKLAKVLKCLEHKKKNGMT